MTVFRRVASYLAFLGVAIFAARAGDTNDPRMNNYDVRHYDIALSFDLKEKSFRGSVAMEAEALREMNELVLCASSETITIDSVTDGGRSLAYQHEPGTLVVALAPSAVPGSVIRLTVYYRAISRFNGAYDDGGVYFTPAGRIATSSEPQFARRWWPCKDMPSDKATVSMQIRVPDSLTVVSNGVLAGVDRRDGFATYRWETRHPIATYLVSIAAANYTMFGDAYRTKDGREVKIEYYVFPEDVDKAREDFKNTAGFLKFLGEGFCEYPFPDEKFGYAEVEGNLTMENQTICSIQNTLLTGDRKNETTIFHETAHQWWGDLITPADWHHTWLSEGFATFAEALYLERTKGKEAYGRRIARMMSAAPGSYAKSVVGRSDTAFWDSFGPSVYFKGAIALHMLRGLLGDSVFFGAMRSYINNPRLRYGTARTEDFVRACQDAAGGRNLSWFFDQWVYASGDSADRPTLAYSWNAEKRPSGYNVDLTIRQENSRTMLYRLTIPVAAYAGGSTYPVTVSDSAAEQVFHFTLPANPDSVNLDPGNSILKTVRMVAR